MASVPQTPVGVNKYIIDDDMWNLTSSSSGSDATGGNHLLPRTGARVLNMMTPSLTPVTEKNPMPRGPQAPRAQRSFSPMVKGSPTGISTVCPRRSVSTGSENVQRSPVSSKAAEAAQRPVTVGEIHVRQDAAVDQPTVPLGTPIKRRPM